MPAPAAPPAPSLQQQQTVARQLQEHLDAELVLHRQLLALAERKQTALLKGTPESFTQLLAEEQPVVGEAGRLRQYRERLLRAVAAILGMAGEDLRLAQIIERLGEALRVGLAQRAADLRKVLDRLRQVNDRNLLLLRQGLAYANELLGAVVGDRGTSPGTYDRRGLGGYVASGGARGGLLNLAG